MAVIIQAQRGAKNTKSWRQCGIAVNTNHLDNIYTASAQRLRRWTNIVWMLYNFFVFTWVLVVQPFNRQIIESEFSPTWSCVSLTRFTTSSDKMIWQNGGQLFSNIPEWCHILSLACLKGGT